MAKEYDITPKLAIAAYNVLIHFCRQQRNTGGMCEKCVFDNRCPTHRIIEPAFWKEIHYPRLIGNTIEYLKDGQLHKLTCSDRRDAERKFDEMRKGERT